MGNVEVAEVDLGCCLASPVRKRSTSAASFLKAFDQVAAIAAVAADELVAQVELFFLIFHRSKHCFRIRSRKHVLEVFKYDLVP